jgi:predicted PurR-regulated permease PerM
MGHLVFCMLHLVALLFGIVGLIITIPLHIIYTKM